MQASLGLAGAGARTLLRSGRAVKTGLTLQACATGDRKSGRGGLSLPGIAG